jgi:nucleoid DNA-binding protein
MTLTRANFAESLFEELGIDRREAKALVELFLKKLRIL